MSFLRLRNGFVVGVAAVLVAAARLEAISVQYSPEASTALSEQERVVIERIATATEIDVKRSLPSLNSELILIVEVGRNVIDQTGETGAAIGPGTLRWTVDHQRPEGVTKIANAHLRSTLFHECHHLVRGWLVTGGARRASFMDAVVAEGLATAFARDTTNVMPPWGDYPADVAAWVRELMALTPGDAWPRYGQWMMLHADGRRWIGYKAGTYIADQAMKASTKSAAELATVPTAEVVRLAGF